ncbi:uncharacterized protein K452DRAFT_64358 [Aplosporella prunicola CBS 121167]|uniref:Uncharacterized protein n=1 Tax=Aplosporella prunicola CBS 121167 TaxID=1176127 RepID=A0A6A6B6S2_9PEZI|nr:uncharacterized protein K452DRAFT_64358 [Aplosporella prunicola CBS 121167]KAF2139710.1 hypothetical protein K452DRAFT_64358 [Aplosporella prunicola CBS 121167]
MRARSGESADCLSRTDGMLIDGPFFFRSAHPSHTLPSLSQIKPARAPAADVAATSPITAPSKHPSNRTDCPPKTGIADSHVLSHTCPLIKGTGRGVTDVCAPCAAAALRSLPGLPHLTWKLEASRPSSSAAPQPRQPSASCRCVLIAQECHPRLARNIPHASTSPHLSRPADCLPGSGIT